MFITTADFLPQHREHRTQVVQIISAAEARGQQRLAEMNTRVLGNLDRIIESLDKETHAGPNQIEVEDNGASSAERKHELTRSKAVVALRELPKQGGAVTFEAVATAAGVSRPWLYTGRPARGHHPTAQRWTPKTTRQEPKQRQHGVPPRPAQRIPGLPL
jgi:hypothetical protein